MYYHILIYTLFVIYRESLSRFLISHKCCTQRNAKQFIKNNYVTVNSKLEKEASFSVDSYNDRIELNGIKLPSVNHIYIMLNKPCGVVCSKVSDSHKTVFSLLENIHGEVFFEKLKCVGRLDCDTKGLLLFSTNGSFINDMTSPLKEIQKTYYVKLAQKTDEKLRHLYFEKIAKGFLLKAEKKSPAFITKPASIEWLSDFELNITVTEGKFHEIRRIFFALGNFVIELKRLSMGNFILDENLKEGQFKFL